MRAPLLTFKRARSLRRRMTPPEVILWQALRRGRLEELRFRRQHPMGPYILDFYCAPARLAVEVDGIGHDHQISRDARRDEWLAEQLRVQARDILNKDRLPEVLSTILAVAAVAPSTAFGGPPPPLRGGGS